MHCLRVWIAEICQDQLGILDRQWSQKWSEHPWPSLDSCVRKCHRASCRESRCGKSIGLRCEPSPLRSLLNPKFGFLEPELRGQRWCWSYPGREWASCRRWCCAKWCRMCTSLCRFCRSLSWRRCASGPRRCWCTLQPIWEVVVVEIKGGRGEHLQMAIVKSAGNYMVKKLTLECENHLKFALISLLLYSRTYIHIGTYMYDLVYKSSRNLWKVNEWGTHHGLSVTILTTHGEVQSKRVAVDDVYVTCFRSSQGIDATAKGFVGIDVDNDSGVFAMNRYWKMCAKLG